VDDGIAALGVTAVEWLGKTRLHDGRYHRCDHYYRWHVGFDPDCCSPQISGKDPKLAGDGTASFLRTWPAQGFCYPARPLEVAA
jgi:hypothetical protein